jgi:hypothetical protein
MGRDSTDDLLVALLVQATVDSTILCRGRGNEIRMPVEVGRETVLIYRI